MTDPTPPPEQPAEQPAADPAAPPQAPYPPAQPPYGWGPTPPPPPRSNAVAWIGVALGGVALLLSLGAIGFAGLAWFSEPDYYDDFPMYEGDPSSDGYIDDQGVVYAIERPCMKMYDIGYDLRQYGPPEELGEGLSTVVAAAREAVTAAEDEKSDEEDVQQWIDEMTLLFDAVDEHAAKLKDGEEAEFQEPTTIDGMSIVGSISYHAPETCMLPPLLELLDPTPPEPFDVE